MVDIGRNLWLVPSPEAKEINLGERDPVQDSIFDEAINDLETMAHGSSQKRFS